MDRRSLGTTLVLRTCTKRHVHVVHGKLRMYFVLFLSVNLLNFGSTQEKKVDGVAEDQCKWSTDGPAAADEIQTKNEKHDTQ